MSKADLAVFLRIGLYALSGYLFREGTIDAETTSLFRTEAVLGALTMGVSLVWWRAARRLGWAT